MCLLLPGQTFIGSILSAVNPYKQIPGVYSEEEIERYILASALSVPFDLTP